jgi:hypothetical protein
MGAGAAGRHLLSHLSRASLLPDENACGCGSEHIETVDLRSLARDRVQLVKVDLLAFRVADLSGWIVHSRLIYELFFREQS